MRREPAFVNEIIARKDKVSEVYFSFGSFPNGRSSILRRTDTLPWEALTLQENDLKRISNEGIPLNLLFNAMCYGEDSQSRAFFESVGQTVDYFQNGFGLKAVTTTSPLIARFIKDNFDGIDVRASVNMSIGSVEGFDYVKDYFDSFYASRELNRDFDALSKIKKWCDENGKSLYGLANSGCLNNCSAHVFHDNLVAHESEIAKMDNGYSFEGICKQYLSKEENRRALVDNTSYIRPEDIYLYEEIFSSLKLATRVHRDPTGVLRAYTSGGFSGNILDLTEPSHSGLIYPYILENRRLKSTVKDGKLKYENFEDALIKLEEDIYVNSTDD